MIVSSSLSSLPALEDIESTATDTAHNSSPQTCTITPIPKTFTLKSKGFYFAFVVRPLCGEIECPSGQIALDQMMPLIWHLWGILHP